MKPLAKRLGSMCRSSGATILGDGAAIMILKPNNVSKSFAGAEHAIGRASDQAAAAAAAAAAKGERDRMSLLLFSAGSSVTVRLSAVAGHAP